MTTASLRVSLARWKTKCFMALSENIRHFMNLNKKSQNKLITTTTKGFKTKQNGCLQVSSGKHPCWAYDIIQSTCPENWVHIRLVQQKWTFLFRRQNLISINKNSLCGFNHMNWQLDWYSLNWRAWYISRCLLLTKRNLYSFNHFHNKFN